MRPDCSASVLTADMEANAVQKKLLGVPVTAWGEFSKISKGVLAQMLVNH